MNDRHEGDGLADHARRLADYAMAFSLLAELASARSEELVIARIVGTFKALCAPARSTYLQVVGSVPGRLVTVPPREDPGAAARLLGGVSGQWARTPSGRGFVLRIDEEADVLGVLEVEDVAVPGSLDHYVNLALGLVSVCALAIRNARTFERLEGTLGDLQRSLAEVKTLKGFIPICASCKKIRDDQGYWEQIENYVARHSDAQFSHGICPECMIRLYGRDTAGV